MVEWRTNSFASFGATPAFTSSVMNVCRRAWKSATRPLRVAVNQEIGLVPFLLFFHGLRLFNPGGSSDLEVALDEDLDRRCAPRSVSRPEPGPWRFGGQPRAEFRHEIWVQGHFVSSAVLGIGSLDHHDRRIIFQVEGLRGQTRQFGSSQSRHTGDHVQIVRSLP